MWISKKKWMALEERIADLEVRVRSQQEQLKARIAPPMNCSVGLGWDASFNRNHLGGEAGCGGGGGINYNSLTIETLHNINRLVSVFYSVVKDGYITVEIKSE